MLLRTRRFSISDFGIGGWVLAIALVASSPTAEAAVCTAPDNGSGTVDLPALGPDCGFDTRSGPMQITPPLLPPATTIDIEIVPLSLTCANTFVCSGVVNPPLSCETTGGALAGNLQCFPSNLSLQITGTGVLAGFSRTIVLGTAQEIHTAPRTPGDSLQTMPSELERLEAQLFGDPDFDFLFLSAGNAFGLPNSGQTQLFDNGDGTFNVDSFFDIEYEISFQGAPGSFIEGLGGTQSGTVRLRSGESMTTSVPSLSMPGAALLAGMIVAGGTWLGARRRSARSR